MVLEIHLGVSPEGLSSVEHLLFLRVLYVAVLLNELAVLRALLGLILALSAGLAVLKNTVCASDGRQKLCFRSEQPLSPLRAVRDHESLARRCLILHLHAVGHLNFLFVFQLGER